MDVTTVEEEEETTVFDESLRRRGGGGGGGELRPNSFSSASSAVSLWFAKLLPRPEVVFICQMLIIYVVIGVSLFNLTRGGAGDAHDGKLWVALLSSCLGYILPNPKIEPRTHAELLNQQQ
jgi:hypothetical protein